MSPSPADRKRMLDEMRRSDAGVSRFRAVAIGAKLGALASVLMVFVVPASVSAWAIVIPGMLAGGTVGWFLTR